MKGWIAKGSFGPPKLHLWPEYGEIVCTYIHKVDAYKMSEIRWRSSGPDVETLDTFL